MPFGLILIDVDRFKAVNDEFGHQTGDEALILLADKLKTFEAAHDCHTGRLGGEEFVLGVSGIAGADLRRLGEAVRTELAKSNKMAREFIGNKAVTVNGEVISEADAELTGSQALHGQYLILKRGKKLFHLAKFPRS